jgi:hypothetical protein
MISVPVNPFTPHQEKHTDLQATVIRMFRLSIQAITQKKNTLAENSRATISTLNPQIPALCL